MKRLMTAVTTLMLVWEDRLKRGERGSVTTERVLWAVAVIAIVGIVVAAVKTFVEIQAGKIN